MAIDEFIKWVLKSIVIFMQNLRFPSCPRANEPAGCHQGIPENSLDNDYLVLCYEKYRDVFVIFIVFIWAIPFLLIFSSIDVTLSSNGLGIFDCISRACWSKSMCGQRTVDVLHWWIIELTISHRDHKQATKRNLTPRICIYVEVAC